MSGVQRNYHLGDQSPLSYLRRVFSAREGPDQICNPCQTAPPSLTRARGAGLSDSEVTDLFTHAETLASRLAGL